MEITEEAEMTGLGGRGSGPGRRGLFRCDLRVPGLAAANKNSPLRRGGTETRNYLEITEEADMAGLGGRGWRTGRGGLYRFIMVALLRCRAGAKNGI